MYELFQGFHLVTSVEAVFVVPHERSQTNIVTAPILTTAIFGWSPQNSPHIEFVIRSDPPLTLEQHERLLRGFVLDTNLDRVCTVTKPRSDTDKRPRKRTRMPMAEYIKVRCSPDGEEQTTITFNPASSHLEIDCSRSSLYRDVFQSWP